MMQPISVTRQNLAKIDFNSILAFEYAEPGAMGPAAGTLSFSTAGGAFYRLDYIKGEVSLGEFRRALHDGFFMTIPIPPTAWHQFYLGAGNYLIIHQIALDKLLTDTESYTPEQVYQNWQSSLGKPLLKKSERYQWLVAKAKASYPSSESGAALTWCNDCEEEINLWTYWQGRNCLSPEILVVGQDWGCPTSKEGQSSLSNIIQSHQYLDNNIFPTDINLAHLFHETFGMDLNQKEPGLFFTNLLLGYRTNGNSGAGDVPLNQDLPFFKELVNILAPKIVICLGKETFSGALNAFGISLPYSGSFNKALDDGKNFVDVDDTRFWGVAHCGTLGCLNRSGNHKGATPEAGLALQVQDWARIKNYLEKFQK